MLWFNKEIILWSSRKRFDYKNKCMTNLCYGLIMKNRLTRILRKSIVKV